LAPKEREAHGTHTTSPVAESNACAYAALQTHAFVTLSYVACGSLQPQLPLGPVVEPAAQEMHLTLPRSPTLDLPFS